MIVPMKKVSLVIQEATRRRALRELRNAGVMHIQRDPGSGTVPEDLDSELEVLESALAAVPSIKSQQEASGMDRSSAVEWSRKVLELKDRESVLLQDLSDYKSDADVLQPWGDFEPADIRILAAKGIDIRLVEADKDLLERLGSDENGEFIPLLKKKGVVSGALIYRTPPEDGGISGTILPEYGVRELNAMTGETRSRLESTREELARLAVQAPAIKHVILAVKQDIEFEAVRNSLAADVGLAWFSGFVPVENLDVLKELASREAWGLLITDPGPEDSVPTLVKNPAAIRIIQPVFKLMGIYPGYRESDISIWFLTFLSIFVAMILGDAAYGLIILGLVLIGRIVTKKSSDVFRLLTVFGLTTFIWGAITGTWFSSLALVRDTPLRNLVVPAFATYQQELFPGYTATLSVFPGDTLDSTAMVKWLSLLFGIVMVSIARIQSFLKKLPSLAAVAQLGWLSIVLALYWLIMNLVLQLSPLPFIMDLLLPMIVGGILVVILFSGQEKGRSFVKGIVEGLKDLLPTLLDSIGAFGDIISFIRLFAVGLAGVALSQSFNAMAPKGGGAAIIAAVVILVLGHTLNIVLNALSVLVHGVRLNVLEFSGHLDMEWAGYGYEPFRLHVPEAESPETHKE